MANIPENIHFEDDFSTWDEEHIFAYALKLFKEQEFYSCHDVLEHLWGFGDLQWRSFYQGLLHLAVSMYHLERENIRGAASLLDSGVALLEQYGPVFGGIDLEKLRDDALKIRVQLKSGSYREGTFLKIEKKGAKRE
jgi:predicted metal-dependent hydrolase